MYIVGRQYKFLPDNTGGIFIRTVQIAFNAEIDDWKIPFIIWKTSN